MILNFNTLHIFNLLPNTIFSTWQLLKNIEFYVNIKILIINPNICYINENVNLL